MQCSTCILAYPPAIAWTFLTNHGHVLVFVARNPEARIREIATAVGVSDRAAQTILNELVEAGYLVRSRHGRRNRYRLNSERPLRHPIEHDHAIGDLLGALGAVPRAPTPGS